MDTIAKVATAMQTVLTTTADQAARATGCVQRVREFTGATFVQTLVFGWLDDPDASLAQLCQVAATRGVTITPQGLAPRFTEQAAACLQQVLEAALRVVIASEPAALPLLDRFAAVVVHDSTIVCLPDALAERWPGGGGGSATGAGTQAALKLQVGLNLRDGTMPHFSLHPGRVQDQAAAPDPAARPADTLVLTDLGYFDRDRLAAHAAAGQHWVLVPKANALVQGPGQPRGTVAARRRRVPPTQAVVDAPVALGASHRLPCRLVAVRAHPQLVARRRRQLRKAARKKGQPVSADQWTLAAWTAYVTTVPAERASVAEVRVLGRVRWQVEVVFKRWKSLGQIDAWRSTQPWRILCEVYAKLLGQILTHWITLTGAWGAPRRSLWQAVQVVRGHARDLARSYDDPVAMREVLALLAHVQRTTCRTTRRANRPALWQLCGAEQVA